MHEAQTRGSGRGGVAHFLPLSALSGAKCCSTSTCLSRNWKRLLPCSSCSTQQCQQAWGGLRCRLLVIVFWEQLRG